MKDCKRNTRDWLNESSRHSFFEILQEAKITPRQMQICEMKFVGGLMNYQIAMKLDVSTKTIDRDISMAYKAINKILSE